MDEFSGKVAIVTGGGSGIGEACATLLAERGAKVLVADVQGEAAQRAADGIGDAARPHSTWPRSSARSASPSRSPTCRPSTGWWA